MILSLWPKDLDIPNLPDFDVLIGGFPCQSFSISAQNPPRLGYKDERGMLFFEMVKILKEKSPSCGSQLIYDGQFSRIKKAGVGVATAYFIQQGMTVYSEETWQLADISF